MTPLEILKSARGLISDEKRWTKDVFARSAKGNPVTPDSKAAVCWCALGAIRHVAPHLVDAVITERNIHSCITAEDNYDMAVFNDRHTHAEVLAAFDEAIKKLEATHA